MTAYADIPGLNWSSLKLIATSPLMLKHRADNPRKDTPALARGRAIHCAILEPALFESAYVEEPDFGDLRTNTTKAERAEWLWSLADDQSAFEPRPDFDLRRKIGKQAKADWEVTFAPGTKVIVGDEHPSWVCPGLEVIAADEYALVTRCAAAVAKHPRAAELLRGGRAEEVLTWTDATTGIACKARCDYIRPSAILDVKTSRHESLRQMRADFARYLYHGQLSFYHQGAKAAGVIPEDADRPFVVVVQTCEPYDVIPMQMSPLDLDAGLRLVSSLMQKYQDCAAAGWWPGMSPEVIEMGIPDWAPSGTDDDGEADW